MFTCPMFWCVAAGNDVMAALTAQDLYRLRVDLWNFEGDYRYAEYETFRVGSAATSYMLTFGAYSGNAGEHTVHTLLHIFIACIEHRIYSLVSLNSGAYIDYICFIIPPKM
jgi:hypothetical protein